MKKFASSLIALGLVGTALISVASSAGAIVGGSETTISEHPWQVSVQSAFGPTPADWEHFCGGSILSTTAILTAAHCTEGETPADIGVRVGMTDESNKDAGQFRGVTAIHDFPQYAIDELGDLSVLILDTPLQLNASVQPISLATAAELADASTATVTGWGDIGENAPGGWPILKVVTLDLVADSVCRTQLAIGPDEELCAFRTGEDSCYSDSGGPLVIDNGQGARLAGVVSWGEECAGPTPGVYAEVPTFAAWIKEMAGLAAAQLPVEEPGCHGEVITIMGTNGDDVLRGTPGRDVIMGLDGDDRIFGLGGNDVICGGFGRDYIAGGDGGDLIYGGSGRDVIRGNRGFDTIYGEAGSDRIWGQGGDDRIFGGGGGDRLLGGIGDDEILGEGGNRDFIDGGRHTDSCSDPLAATVIRDCEFS